MKIFQILLISTILGLCCAGDLHRVAGARWNNPQQGKNTVLGLYFTLDTALPKGGNLVFTSGTAALSSWTTTCNVYPVTTTLDPNAFTSKTAGEVSGTLTSGTCVLGGALNANTAYAMMVVGTEAVAGVYGPLGLTTYAYGATGGVMLDQNNELDMYSVLAAPTDGLVLAVSQDKTDTVNAALKTELGKALNFNFEFTFPDTLKPSTDATAPFYVMAPFNVVIEMVQPSMTSKLATSQWSWNTAGTCNNYQFGQNAAEKVDNKIVPELALGNLACTDAKGVLTVPVPKNDLSIKVAWSKFLLNFRLSLKMPTTYVGSSAPTFKSSLQKDGQLVLNAAADAACSDCAVTYTTGATGAGNSVQLSWGLSQSSKDGVAAYASPYCLTQANIVLDTTVADTTSATNCALTGTATANVLQGTAPSNSVQFQWKMHQAIPDDSTNVDFVCKMSTSANSAFLLVNQATAQFHGWGRGNCWYAGVTATTLVHNFKCVDTGKLDKDSVGYLSFQFQLLSGPKAFGATSGVVTTPYTKMTCTATVSAQSDTWYTVATELLKIDNGDAYKYETFVAAMGESSVPMGSGNNVMSPATGTAKKADFVFTWRAFPKADGRWATVAAGKRFVPVELTAVVGKDLQVNVYGATTFLSAGHSMTTALVGGNTSNPYQAVEAKNTWLVAATGMDKNTASSTGGYVSYTAGQLYGGECTVDGTTAANCDAAGNLPNYFMAHGVGAANTKEVAYNSFTWTTGELYTNPKFLTTFRGRGEFSSGSFSTTNQALNDYFWTVALNGTTEWTTGWMVSTVSHVYLTVVPTSLYGTWATQDMGTAKVAVSFPVWAYGGTVTNTGSVAPNLVKITVAATNPNQFVGFFIPTGQPFMHSDGGNRVQVVGKDASCWVYGQANGNGYLQNLATGDCGATAGIPQCLSSPVFTLSAPYLVYTTMNFLACDVSTAQTAHDVYVPFRNNDYANTWDTADTLLLKSLTRDVYTKRAGMGSLLLAQVQVWDTQVPTATASVTLTANTAVVGYYVLFGASRYLNKMTGYAQGFQAAAGEALTKVLQAGNAAASGPVGGTVVTASATDYDVVADPDTTMAGKAGVYKLLIKSGSVAANNMAVMSLCGKAGLLGGVGDVSTANPATNDNKCQSLSFNGVDTVVNSVTVKDPRMCYYCSMAASTASQSLWMSALNPPLYAGRKVKGFHVSTSTVGEFEHVLETTDTHSMLKVDSVSACSGPATVNMGVKGQTATFSVTTKNAVATGTTLLWVGVKDTPVNMQASVGTDSGVLSCGSYTQVVTPTVAGKMLRATLTDATNTNGAAACGAGPIQLVVREFTSTNADTADQKKKTNCMVCVDDTSCNAFTTTANIEADATAYAIGKDTVNWEFNQSGTSKATTLTADNMVHSVDVKGAVGSWAFTPSVGALGLWKDQTTVTYTFGDASFTGSVCQIVGSTAISKCEPSGSSVKLTWGADASSVDFTVRLLNVPAWKPTSLKVQAASTMYGTSVLSNPLLTAQQSFTAPAAAPATLTTVALVSSYKNSGDLGTLRFDLTMGLLTSWKQDDTMTVNMPVYYQPRLGGQAACWLWVQEEDPKDATKTVTVQKEQLYCEHVQDWTLKVWGPQNNEQVKSTKTGATFQFSVVVTGVQMHKTTAGKFQVLSEGWVNVKTTTKVDGKDVVKETMTATTEYGTVTDGATNEWSQSTVDLQSVVATGTSARATTSLTVKFVTSDSVKMDTSNFVGLELPYQWGNVLRGASGSATVTTVGAVKLSEWSVVNKLPKETDVEVKLDAGSVSGRSFKVCTVPKVSADGKTTTAVVLKKSTNYTLTVASLATPSGASTWGQVRVTVGDKALGGFGTSNAQMATVTVKNTQFGYGTLSALGFASGMTTVNRGTYSGQVCVQAASGNLGTGVSVAVVGKLFVMVPATLVGVQGQAQVCGLLGTAATTQGSKFQVGFTLTQTETVYTKLPQLTVSVSEATVQVKTASSVNCVAAGSSDPVVFSTAAAPSGTLTLELVKKVKAKTDTVEPSLGVTTLGAKYAFGVGKLGGFFYLTCDAKLPASPASKLSYKLDGTAKASYTLQNADLTVNMVKPATRDAKAVMAVATAASGNTASQTSVTVMCPASGTAYVQWVPLELSAASKRWATAADAAAAWAVWSGRAANPNEWQVEQMARAAVTAAATATTLGPFQSASKRQYHAWAYCLDASNNYYAQEKPSNVTAVDNGGAVLNLAYTFDTADVNACKDNAMVLDVCCTVASGLGRPQNAVVDEFGGWCGNPSATKPATCPKPVAPVANKTANATANATKPAARVLQTAPAANVTSSKVVLSVQPDPRAAKATSSAELTTAVAALHSKVKTMLTAKNYKVTLGAAPTVAVAAAEAAVAWKVKPSAVADFTFVTLSGTTSAAGNVYCFVSKAGTAKPKATTTRILQAANTTAAANATAPAATAPAAADPWAWEKSHMNSLGDNYNAQRVLTKATAFTFSMKFDGLTEDRVYKWVCQATSVNPSMSAALYRTDAVMNTVTTKLTPPKSSSDSVIMTSVFSAIVMLITAFYY